MRRAGLLVAVLSALLAGCAGESGMMVGKYGTVRGTLVAPDGPGPYPGVLILESSKGLQGGELGFAHELAKQGYVCLIPAYLEAMNLGGNNRQIGFTTAADTLIADLSAAARQLAANEKVRGSKIGAVGFSNGGFFTVALAATHQIDAGVSYYGAVTGAGTDRELERFKATLSPASAPLLLLVGTGDSYSRPSRRLRRIGQEAGARVRLVLYEGAHHEFDRFQQGPADQAATSDAWTRTVAFLDRNLKPHPGGLPPPPEAPEPPGDE